MKRKWWVFRVLVWLYILQEKDNRGRIHPLGKGYRSAYRFNPWHPLSYPIVLITVLIVAAAIVCTELAERWTNPFKWN